MFVLVTFLVAEKKKPDKSNLGVSSSSEMESTVGHGGDGMTTGT